MPRFKNPTDSVVSFTFRDGKDPVRVKGGESVSTNDEEVITALRKAGFKKESSKESVKESSSSSVSSWRKKEE